MPHLIVPAYRLIPALILAITALSAAHARSAADAVSIDDPYVRLVPPVVKTTAAFMAIRGAASGDHAIVAAQSPASATVELHTHTMDGAVMRMRRIPRIGLPAGQTTTLEPGGLHIMLLGLQRPLVEGETLPLTLVFDDQSTKTLSLQVRRVDPGMMKHDHKH